MKVFESIKKIDTAGRISIPAKYLRHLAISQGSYALMYLENDYIIFEKYQVQCAFCEERDDLLFLPANLNVGICKNCRMNKEHIHNLVSKRYAKVDIPKDNRFVIPFKIRHSLDLNIDDSLLITLHSGYIKIEKT